MNSLLHAANIPSRSSRCRAGNGLESLADKVRDAVARADPEWPDERPPRGTWVGPPASHDADDLPIGFWTSAFVLDIIGANDRGRPAELPRRFGRPQRAAGCGQRRGRLDGYEWPFAPCRARSRGREHIGRHACTRGRGTQLAASACRGRSTRFPRRDRGDDWSLPRRPLTRAPRYRSRHTGVQLGSVRLDTTGCQASRDDQCAPRRRRWRRVLVRRGTGSSQLPLLARTAAGRSRGFLDAETGERAHGTGSCFALAGRRAPDARSVSDAATALRARTVEMPRATRAHKSRSEASTRK